MNTFIVLIWAFTNQDAFFWPIFPIVGWGIGVVMNGWDVYSTREASEEEIERQMMRLQRRG